MNPEPEPETAESIAKGARKIKTVAERRTFVDHACRGDQTLRGVVVSLLTAGDGGMEFHFPDDVPSEKAGETIGRYTLVRELGEGGFGTVWLADQREPVQRKVALKIIKLGMDTRQVVARFEQERQALALMDHPNVARVLDAGATATGRPYFVMDVVEGEPIGAYCDRNNLTVTERLEVFAQVCAAVQHAHSKGIIHRDLKPSNVLVSTLDGKPHPTVIDFGIAKATSADLNRGSLVTAHQQVIGTLYYMSPEQADGSLDIDTRADVYSLGVMLYELLTGTTPFAQDTSPNAMFAEVQRQIREVEPRTPSSRITDSRDTLPVLAAHRRIEPKRLGALVRGELDWIVMKALAKERARRYETANALAGDIRRYLKGEAITAAPPSKLYRCKKLVQRNRGAVAAALGIAAALLAGVVAFAWQARVAQDERDTAVKAKEAEAEAHARATALGASEAKQRAIAEASAAKAEAINGFLLTILRSANPRDLGRDVKVVQALDRAAAGVAESFRDRPEVEAGVRQSLSRTYLALGMADEADPQIARTMELQRTLHGERSMEFAECLRDSATALSHRGKAAEAIAPGERAVAIAREVAGPDALATLGFVTDYANALVLVNREAEAEKLFRDILSVRRRLGATDTSDFQITLNSLAVLLHRMNRVDEAEALYREALEVGLSALGAEHPDTLTAQLNLASVLRTRHKYSEAEPIMEATYADVKRVFGENHRQTGIAAGVLGGLYSDEGRFKDARPLLEHAVATRRQLEGDDAEAVAEVKGTLAHTLKRLGDYARAATLLEEVVKVWTASGGADSLKAMQTRLDLANTLAAADRNAEAEAIFKVLLEQFPRVHGADHPSSIVTLNSYAVLLLGQDRYAEAEPYIRKALEAGRRVGGPDNKDTIITQYNLTPVLRELGRLDEADKLGRDTVERFCRVFGAKHSNVATARTGLAETLIKLGRNDEATTELVAAIAIQKEALGAKNPAFCGIAITLGKLLIDTGHAADAEPVLRDAVDVNVAARGANDRRTAAAQVELGRCLAARKQFVDAEALLLANHAILLAAYPAGHKSLTGAERSLAGLYADWNTAEPDATRAGKADHWKAKLAERAAAASKPAAPL